MKTYRLSWYSYVRSLGYLLVAEIFLLGLLSIPERGQLVGFLLGLWWLWPSLTILVGLAARAGTRLTIGPELIGLATFGKTWRSLYWHGISRARLLKVGGTVAILALDEQGGVRIWRQSGLAAPDEAVAEIRKILGAREDPALVPLYRTRRGRVWSVEADRILFSAPGGEGAFEPESLQGVKFLFVEGEDLPVRVHLFPIDGDRAPLIGQSVSFFLFLAADILRFARQNGIRMACADLGQDRPRISRRHEESRTPTPRRAWEDEGWR